MGESIYIWRIATNYTSAKVYTARVGGQLIGTSSIKLDKGLTRRQRYDEIEKWLAERFGGYYTLLLSREAREGSAMIGHVIMEIEADEMRAAVAFYLNRDVFDADGSLRVQHKAVVTEVRQRSSGNFVIEFERLASGRIQQPRSQ